MRTQAFKKSKENFGGLNMEVEDIRIPYLVKSENLEGEKMEMLA